MYPDCPRCAHRHTVKNGFMEKKQRFLCRGCGYQFTRTTPRGHPLKDKAMAVVLYLSGVSMNMTAQILGVSTPTIMRWLEWFDAEFGELPAPSTETVSVEIDEMWHFIGQKNKSSGYGKSFAVIPKDSWPGVVVIALRKP